MKTIKYEPVMQRSVVHELGSALNEPPCVFSLLILSRTTNRHAVLVHQSKFYQATEMNGCLATLSLINGFFSWREI